METICLHLVLSACRLTLKKKNGRVSVYRYAIDSRTVLDLASVGAYTDMRSYIAAAPAVIEWWVGLNDTG
jgi:hypothetical protein